MMFGRGKKGEMTTQQIVILIVAIVSFAIILFFIFGLGLGEKTNEDICYNSVITRANSPVDTSLDCKRGYVCLTADGSCEEMTSPTKEKVKTKEEVYKTLAEYSATCWWMFGEGKVDYLGSSTLPELKCSICYQVGFDNSLIEKGIFSEGKIDRNEFYKYLEETKVSNKDYTYAEYLYPGYDLSVLLSEYDTGDINLTKPYFILLGANSDVSTLTWIATGVGVGAAIVFTGGLAGVSLPFIAVGTATATGIGAGVGGVAGGFLAPVIEGESGNDFIPPLLVEANSDEYKALECKEITTQS